MIGASVRGASAATPAAGRGAAAFPAGAALLTPAPKSKPSVPSLAGAQSPSGVLTRTRGTSGGAAQISTPGGGVPTPAAGMGAAVETDSHTPLGLRLLPDGQLS